MGRRKYNWEAAKLKYVQGIVNEEGKRVFPTLEEIAKELGCHVGLVYRRAAKEKWTFERELFLRKLEEEHKRKRIEKVSKDLSQIEDRVTQGLKFATAQLTKHIADRANRGEDFSLSEIETIVRIFSRIQQATNLLLGKPTHIVQSFDKDVKQVIKDRETAIAIITAVRQVINKKALTKKGRHHE